MTGSVRWRLTIAVVLVVGSLAVVAALLAPRSVRGALIDDRLDAEVPVEADALATRFVVTSVDGTALGSPELTALFGPDLAGLTASLDGTGALDRLRSFRDDERLLVAPVSGVLGEIETDGRIRVDDGLVDSADGPIVTGARLEQLAAELGTASVFDAPFDVFADSGTTFDEYLADLDARFGTGTRSRLDLGGLEQFPALDGQPFPRELFDRLQRDLIDGLSTPIAPISAPRTVDQLVFGTRSVGGIDVIVSASAEGIELSVDRVRTALWATVPIAMLLTGLITWMLAGRALRPVRLITAQTGRIRAGTLHERVPVPRSRDEVAGLASEMNDMLDRLQRDDRRRRQFVADASHELRSPIAAIHTQAEVALAESPDGSSAELASGVLAEAQRLGSIVDDLLALARHDESLAPPGTIVDLDDIVLTEAIRQRRVPVDTGRVSAGRVRGRPDELARVVTHLLDNAARHARSKVEVSLRTNDDAVILIVDDDGPGVPLDDRERIFDRFVRLDEARQRDGGGAGLGLAVVATVVHAAGGTIDVTSSDSGGARFSVLFPAVS